MSDEKKGWFESRAKRFTVYGTAFLVLLAVMGGLGTLAVKAYGVGQRVEVYIGLPDWLEKVEANVKENGRKLDDLSEKVDQLLHRREHRRRTGESSSTD